MAQDLITWTNFPQEDAAWEDRAFIQAQFPVFQTFLRSRLLSCFFFFFMVWGRVIGARIIGRD